MEIFRPILITDEIAEAFESLIPQLSRTATVPDKAYLQSIVDSGNSYLFVAKEGKILGTLTLVIYTIPTGQKAWIEDVVVDSEARGKGVAQKLIEAAVELAIENGIKKIDLTSSRARIAAHGLYKKLKFEERDTSVFRLTLK